MKTLVIHPADASTDFLNVIYEGKDWTIVNHEMSKKGLKRMIKDFDRIIMLGHGDERGLYGFDKFVIDKSFMFYLRQKLCVCIWCNANSFVYKYGLRGLYTGMIVSEYEEATLFSLYPVVSEKIEQSNTLFAQAIAKHIDGIGNLATLVKEDYFIAENNIVDFNINNIFYK